VTAHGEPVIVDPERQLGWEKRHRPRAAIAALLGAIGLLVVNITEPILQKDAPRASGLETLQRAVEPGNVGKLPSLQAPFFEYLDSKSALVLAIGIGGFIGWLGVAWAVGFLGVATRSRVPMFRRWIVYVPIIGGVLVAVGALLLQVGRLQVTHDFLAGDRTVQSVKDANGSVIAFAQLVGQLGTLASAIGIVLVSLNAMRAGLMTRMLGYLGIASGAMLVLIALPLIQIFWLGGLALVLIGRWPGGDLLAWRTGQAEPWPTAERPPPRQRREVAAPAASPSPAPRRKRKKRH